MVQQIHIGRLRALNNISGLDTMMKVSGHFMKKNSNALVLFSIVLSLGILPVCVSGLELSPLDFIENYDYQNPRVQREGTVTYIEYYCPVDAIAPSQIEMNNIAGLLASYGYRNNRIIIRQYFSDGQLLEISGYPDDGKAFLRNSMTIEEFTVKLIFQPRTRGILFTSDTCSQVMGESCKSNPECACYPNEICDPANSKANTKGCVVVRAPANALAWGDDYVCREGYSWNSDATGCIPSALPSTGRGYGDMLDQDGAEDIGVSAFIPCIGILIGLFIFYRLQYLR